MHDWLRLTDWTIVSGALLGWIVAIALLGYVAAVVAWRERKS